MLRVAVVLGVLLAGGVSLAAPVPKAIKAKAPVRKRIEPLPGEKVYSVDWNDAPFVKVAEDLERATRLLYLSKACPKLSITLKADEVCMAELFAQLDEVLYPQGWVFVRKSQSFCTLPTEELGRINVMLLPAVKLDELERRSPLAPVKVILDVGEKGVDAGKKAAKGVEEAGFEVTNFGSDKLVVRGLGKDVQKFVDEMADHIKK